MMIQSVGWRNTGKPFMKVSFLHDEQSHFSFRGTFSIKISQKKKKCIGYYDTLQDDYISCASELEDSNKSQCSVCAKKGEVFWKNIHSLNIDQRVFLQAIPTTNYLAVFPGGKLKTGVALTTRRESRVLEQGALYAIFFTSTDGVTARHIEEDISQKLSITQSLSWKQKLMKIKDVPSESIAFQTLNETIEKYKITSLYTNHFGTIEKYDAQKMFDFPFNKIEREIVFLSKLTYGEELSGEYIGLYGTIMIFMYDSKIYAIDIRSLLGFTIDIKGGGLVNVSERYLHNITLERNQRLL